MRVISPAEYALLRQAIPARLHLKMLLFSHAVRALSLIVPSPLILAIVAQSIRVCSVPPHHDLTYSVPPHNTVHSQYTT